MPSFCGKRILQALSPPAAVTRYRGGRCHVSSTNGLSIRCLAHRQATIKASLSTVRTTRSPSRPIDELSSQSGYTKITIQTPTGHQTRHIKRSYPNGKPEKLISGLERLLSNDNDNGNGNGDSTGWILTTAGDTISRFLVLTQREHLEHLDPLIQSIRQASDQLAHHPHSLFQYHEPTRCCVFGVLCTTHNPYGLSLNDVKLADRIDRIAVDLGIEQAIPSASLSSSSTRTHDPSIVVRDGERDARTDDNEHDEKAIANVKRILFEALMIETKLSWRKVSMNRLKRERQQQQQERENNDTQTVVDDEERLDRDFGITDDARRLLEEVRMQQDRDHQFIRSLAASASASASTSSPSSG